MFTDCNTVNMDFQTYTDQDFDKLLEMALVLWPDFGEAGLKRELQNMATSERQETILARENEDYIGFITVSTRIDYVEGATSSPVGYIEGIFVKPDYRKTGIGRQLYQLGEQWCLKKGCQQMGSDAYAWNKQSHEFHKRLGFDEEDTLVHFIKDIG